MTIRPRIHRCFVAWLESARPRLAVQPRVTGRSDRRLDLAFDGLTPAIGAYVSRFDIDVWVIWEGTCWDLVFSEWVAIGGRRGAYVCEACPPALRTETFASREALWRAHLFERFLDWINATLAPASALALYGAPGGTTWVTLLRDGVEPAEGPPPIILPLRVP